MSKSKLAFKISHLVSLTIAWLLLFQFIRLFFSSVFFINLVQTEINYVSFVFLLFFFLPLILVTIPKKFFNEILILVILYIAYISRFLIMFCLSPMVNIILSSLGAGLVLTWLAIELLKQNKEDRLFLAYSFTSALLVDLSLRLLGNSIDVSNHIAINAIIVLIGVISSVIAIKNNRKQEIEKENEAQLNSNELSEKSIEQNIAASEKRSSSSSFIFYKTSFILFSSLFLFSLVLNVPSALSHWDRNYNSTSPHFWILSAIILIFLALILGFYSKIIYLLHSINKYIRLTLFLIAELLLIPLLSVPSIIASYIATISVPILALFTMDIIQSAKIEKSKKTTFLMIYGLGIFIMLLLFLFNIFAFNYDYVPAGSFFKAINNWLILIPLILSSFFILKHVNTETFGGLKQKLHSTRISFYSLVTFVTMAFIFSSIFYNVQQSVTYPNSPNLKVVTYNIQQGYSNNGKYNYHSVYLTLQELDADLISLQETETNRITSGNMDIVQWLAWKLNMYYVEGPALDDLCYGVGLLSRYPIESYSVHLMPSEGEQTAFISAIIKYNNKEINIIATHFGEHPKDKLDQAETIYHYVNNLPYSYGLLMGDFNVENGSDPYSVLTQKYHDSWLALYPSGTNTTGYNGDSCGDTRIDLIFYYGQWTVHYCRVVTESLASDHKPVVAIMSVKV